MPIDIALRDLESCAHMVQFYASEEEFVVTVGAYLTEALGAGETAMMLATPGHRAVLQSALSAAGVDVPEALKSGRLVCVDAAQTLEQILVDGWPDPEAFEAVVGALLRRTAQAGRRCRVFGELVALLWEAGDPLAAIELEVLWNEIGRDLTFALLCAYPNGGSVGADHVEEVIKLHAAVKHPYAPQESWELNGTARAFPASRAAPRLARAFVREALQAKALSSDTVDKALVVVSELATNAVVHAASPFNVTLTFPPDGGVRIALRDESRALPAPNEAAGLREAGRGIVLVAALATRWDVDVHEHGKSVWAEIG